MFCFVFLAEHHQHLNASQGTTIPACEHMERICQGTRLHAWYGRVVQRAVVCCCWLLCRFEDVWRLVKLFGERKDVLEAQNDVQRHSCVFGVWVGVQAALAVILGVHWGGSRGLSVPGPYQHLARISDIATKDSLVLAPHFTSCLVSCLFTYISHYFWSRYVFW